MINIRKLIKESLRENLNMLEAKTKFDSSMANVFSTMFKIAKAQEMYGPNSGAEKEVKKYFNSEYEGQGVYPVVISPSGKIMKSNSSKNSAADDIANDNIGLVGKKASYMAFNIMANRGIEHKVKGPIGSSNEPRTGVAITRKGLQSAEDDSVINTEEGRKLSTETEYLKDNEKLLTYINTIKDEEKRAKLLNIISNNSLEGKLDVTYDVPGSPYSDAIIKTYLKFGEMILDFVITNTPGFDAYTTYNDAKSTDAYKQMAADPVRMKHALRMEFRRIYKEKTGKEPSEQEIKDFLQSGEENVEQYLDRNDIKKGERNLISLRNEPDFDISSLNRRDQGRYRTYQDLVRKQERGQVLTNDEKRDFRTLSAKFEKLKKGL